MVLFRQNVRFSDRSDVELPVVDLSIRNSERILIDANTNLKFVFKLTKIFNKISFKCWDSKFF